MEPKAPRRVSIVVIIPARFGSVRLPGKPLLHIDGKPMVQHVYERAAQARSVARVLVATDDERIAAAVRGFGGEAVLTASQHATGTDRLAEAVRSLGAEIVVNVQGDEPLIDPASIDAAVEPVRRSDSLEMSTLSVPLTDPDEMLAPSVVKVVVNARGDALYFSRSPLPYFRLDASHDLKQAAGEAVRRGLARKHVGLYVYRRTTLLRLAALAPAPLELAEGLEQLRALHHGIGIRVVPLDGPAGPAVDTADDLARVRALFDRAS